MYMCIYIYMYGHVLAIAIIVLHEFIAHAYIMYMAAIAIMLSYMPANYCTQSNLDYPNPFGQLQKSKCFG